MPLLVMTIPLADARVEIVRTVYRMMGGTLVEEITLETHEKGFRIARKGVNKE